MPKPPTCPYCGAESELVHSSVVYGFKAGKNDVMYVCKNYPKCDSYVNAHRDSNLPLGTLADATLRAWRKMAHDSFDKIWKDRKRRKMTRYQAYGWLADKLNIPRRETHIGFFDEETCKEVINLSNQYVKKYLKRGAVK